MCRITYGYKRRQSDILLTSMCVISKMENNPYFPKPPAALAKLKTTVPKFQTALANALGRDKEMVAIKDNIKELVLNLLQELVSYVMEISKGDRIMILSSGFDASKEPSKTWVEPVIEELEVILGGAGIANIQAKKVRGIKAYTHQYTYEQPGPNTQWVSEVSSVKKHTFKGLQSEKRYWFRVLGIGTRRRKSYSPIVSVVIQ
ncbi:MAG TPA: hypothetical protein VM187_06960 [Niastella sp.]|nr:hypothetical protein [Niastella sp.]